MWQWHDVLSSGIPLSEKVFRTVAVYAVLAVLLRLVGRRDLAQFTTFDLVVVLLLSNVVQNAIIGPDDSLVGGLVGAGVLLLVNALVVRVGTSSDRAEAVFEGRPETLAADGQFVPAALRRLGVRANDLRSALRLQGAGSVADVERAQLMPSGTLLVDLKEEAQPATRGDIRRLLDRIDALEAAMGHDG